MSFNEPSLTVYVLACGVGSAGVYLPCGVYDGAAFLFLRAFSTAGAVMDEVRAAIPQLPAEETVAPHRPWPRVT